MGGWRILAEFGGIWRVLHRARANDEGRRERRWGAGWECRLRGSGDGVVEWSPVGAGGWRAAGEHRWPIVAAEEARREEEGGGELSMASQVSE